MPYGRVVSIQNKSTIGTLNTVQNKYQGYMKIGKTKLHKTSGIGILVLHLFNCKLGLWNRTNPSLGIMRGSRICRRWGSKRPFPTWRNGRRKATGIKVDVQGLPDWGEDGCIFRKCPFWTQSWPGWRYKNRVSLAHKYKNKMRTTQQNQILTPLKQPWLQKKHWHHNVLHLLSLCRD